MVRHTKISYIPSLLTLHASKGGVPQSARHDDSCAWNHCCCKSLRVRVRHCAVRSSGDHSNRRHERRRVRRSCAATWLLLLRPLATRAIRCFKNLLSIRRPEEVGACDLRQRSCSECSELTSGRALRRCKARVGGRRLPEQHGSGPMAFGSNQTSRAEPVEELAGSPAARAAAEASRRRFARSRRFASSTCTKGSGPRLFPVANFFRWDVPGAIGRVPWHAARARTNESAISSPAYSSLDAPVGRRSPPGEGDLLFPSRPTSTLVLLELFLGSHYQPNPGGYVSCLPGNPLSSSRRW
jgi:hypothetical protein